MIFLHHAVIQNNPSNETFNAGLGPSWIYGIIIIIMVVIGFIYLKNKLKRGKR